MLTPRNLEKRAGSEIEKVAYTSTHFFNFFALTKNAQAANF